MVQDERRQEWNNRHAAGDFEGIGPNPTLSSAVEPIKPGTALELACGSGTNAVWLATHGWRTTAVDWSAVGLANGRAKADAAGVTVDWQEHDLTSWSPAPASFDLVVLVYFHMPPDERRPVYAAAAAAVAPGGHFVLVGHDRLHGAEGQPGPDPEKMFTAREIGSELTAADPTLDIERAEVVRRVPLPEHGPIDALLVLQRR